MNIKCIFIILCALYAKIDGASASNYFIRCCDGTLEIELEDFKKILRLSGVIAQHYQDGGSDLTNHKKPISSDQCKELIAISRNKSLLWREDILSQAKLLHTLKVTKHNEQLIERLTLRLRKKPTLKDVSENFVKRKFLSELPACIKRQLLAPFSCNSIIMHGTEPLFFGVQGYPNALMAFGHGLVVFEKGNIRFSGAKSRFSNRELERFCSEYPTAQDYAFWLPNIKKIIPHATNPHMYALITDKDEIIRITGGDSELVHARRFSQGGARSCAINSDLTEIAFLFDGAVDYSKKEFYADNTCSNNSFYGMDVDPAITQIYALGDGKVLCCDNSNKIKILSFNQEAKKGTWLKASIKTDGNNDQVLCAASSKDTLLLGMKKRLIISTGLRNLDGFQYRPSQILDIFQAGPDVYPTAIAGNKNHAAVGLSNGDIQEFYGPIYPTIIHKNCWKNEKQRGPITSITFDETGEFIIASNNHGLVNRAQSVGRKFDRKIKRAFDDSLMALRDVLQGEK